MVKKKFFIHLDIRAGVLKPGGGFPLWGGMEGLQGGMEGLQVGMEGLE